MVYNKGVFNILIMKYLFKETINHYRPQIKWEYPLNLSILISGGKETNKDFLSNGEWRGKSSNLKSDAWEGIWIVVFGYVFGWQKIPKCLGKGHQRRW